MGAASGSVTNIAVGSERGATLLLVGQTGMMMRDDYVFD
jgi:hypothetical protein